MTNRFTPAVVAVLGALLIVPVGAEIVEQVVVKVNGDILSKSDFEQRQVAALRSRPELANVTPESPQLKTAVEEITPNLILDAVDELLLVQRGRELGYVLGDDQFKSILENIKKQNNLEDETRFQAALKQENMTLADLRKSLERQMVISRVQQNEVAGRISVTEDEAKAYYAAHPKEFTSPATVTLREILVEVPVSSQGINVAADDEAKEKALTLRNRLLGGEPFARLAAEASSAASKANGGLIGPIAYEELSPGLQKVVDGMKPNDISEPVRAQRGYQLFKLEARSDVKVKTLEEARSRIGEKIGDLKMQGERDKYLEKLRQEATIVWHNDELKKAYDQALSVRGASPAQQAEARK